jgi:hypothetical protein
VSDPNSGVCSHLGRDDGKWYLGGGERVLFAPPHPEYTEVPGFWDDAHYYDFAVPTPFTVTLLDDEGRPLNLRSTGQHWRPDRLRQTFATNGPIEVVERRAVCPTDVLLSTFTLRNLGAAPQTVRLVAWTRRPAASSGAGLQTIETLSQQVRFTERLRKDDRPAHDIGGALGLRPAPQSASAVVSESGPRPPRWSYTPFYETHDGEELGPALDRPDEVPPGTAYAGLLAPLTVPPDGTASATAALGMAPTARQAGTQVASLLDEETPLAQSTQAWADHFERVPSLSCSDDHLETTYWYRWYGLHLLSRTEPEGNFRYPAVYEGPEYFRKHITYSAQCHMREMRWLPEPTFAQGSLLNFIDGQRDDGGFYGHVFPHHVHDESFYHTNWGHTWGVHRVHPDPDFLKRAYDGLASYVDYFDRERDPEDSGLYDIFNHYETGQEYMHRYVAVEPEADAVHWGRIFRLKGVDAAVQLYETKQALARMAEALDRPGDAERWEAGAQKTGEALRSAMWDPDDELFYDVDPETGERTGVKAAVCFYPYFTDLVEERHLPGLKRHLSDPDAFWTPYPVPATGRDDPTFSAAPHWKGQRKNCPWNGRVWPMTNSHVAEALGQAALRFGDDALRARTATFIHRFTQMLFFDGDPDRPNCFEHYNPLTGQACRYRGIDDYQHSWIVDLLIRYLAGVRPKDDHVVVDPFPFEVEHVAIEDVPVRGHQVAVVRDGDRFRVDADGETVARSGLGDAVRLDL